MSDTPESGRIPKMPPETAQDIARGLKWLAQSYAEAGMSVTPLARIVTVNGG